MNAPLYCPFLAGDCQDMHTVSLNLHQGARLGKRPRKVQGRSSEVKQEQKGEVERAALGIRVCSYSNKIFSVILYCCHMIEISTGPVKCHGLFKILNWYQKR